LALTNGVDKNLPPSRVACRVMGLATAAIQRNRR